MTRRVKILVTGAKNLKSPDQHFINSNPYCQVEVEGSKSKVCSPRWLDFKGRQVKSALFSFI